MTLTHKELKNCYNSLYTPLCLFANKYLNNIEQAEDIVQEVFIKVWEKQLSFPSNESLKSFLYTAVKRVNGKILWANLSLLFALSLIPFTTGWMGENHFQENPVVLYGCNLLFTAITFIILEHNPIKLEGRESILGTAIKSYTKEYASMLLYIMGILLAYYMPILGLACYIIVAILWLIPDKRIEKVLEQ